MVRLVYESDGLKTLSTFLKHSSLFNSEHTYFIDGTQDENTVREVAQELLNDYTDPDCRAYQTLDDREIQELTWIIDNIISEAHVRYASMYLSDGMEIKGIELIDDFSLSFKISPIMAIEHKE